MADRVITFTITNAAGGAVLPEAHVRITSDSAGVTTITSGECNNSGVLVLTIADGGPYSVWLTKPGYTRTNPSALTVSANAAVALTMTAAAAVNPATVQDVITEVRFLLGDDLGAGQWLDADLIRLVNRGQLEVYRVRSDLFLSDALVVSEPVAVDAVSDELRINPERIDPIVCYTHLWALKRGTAETKAAPADIQAANDAYKQSLSI